MDPDKGHVNKIQSSLILNIIFFHLKKIYFSLEKGGSSFSRLQLFVSSTLVLSVSVITRMLNLLLKILCNCSCVH